jgi:hypothetical protein
MQHTEFTCMMHSVCFPWFVAILVVDTMSVVKTRDQTVGLPGEDHADARRMSSHVARPILRKKIPWMNTPRSLLEKRWAKPVRMRLYHSDRLTPWRAAVREHIPVESFCYVVNLEPREAVARTHLWLSSSHSVPSIDHVHWICVSMADTTVTC